MSGSRRPDARGERTRQRILEAAFEEVAERPLAEVQLQDIARRAGMSPGHVLYHFESKDRILLETLIMNETRIAEERAALLEGLADPWLKLTRWVVLYLPRRKMDPGWKLWLELWFRSGIPSVLEESGKAQVFVTWMKDLRDIVESGVAADAFVMPDDLDRFLQRTHSLLVGLSIGVLAGWQSLDDAVGMAMEYLSSELGRSPATVL
ncbi:MAG TPA: helix-turn-helix domain-containing protein [Actinomycetes bacterium]|nr:helix-turn-helix domain-containing protein [Actinomycetes bacterium]